MALLEVSQLTKAFGGLVALAKVDLTVEQGEIHGLIGPNGAGKTTLFNVVTGLMSATGGAVTLDGKVVLGRRPHQITRMGMARTFQNIRLFAAMTALENVIVGLDAHHRSGVLDAVLRTPRARREDGDGVRDAFALLEQAGIRQLANQLSKNLSYGDQRRVEIARALGTRPRLLLLDEPAAGMNPAEKAALMGLVRSIRDTGTTILLIEHDMKLVMGICDRITVLDFGERIADGPPSEIQRNPRVIEAYLGKQKASGDS